MILRDLALVTMSGIHQLPVVDGACWLVAALGDDPSFPALLRSAGTLRSVSWTPYGQGSTICMTVLAAIASPAPGVTPSTRWIGLAAAGQGAAGCRKCGKDDRSSHVSFLRQVEEMPGCRRRPLCVTAGEGDARRSCRAWFPRHRRGSSRRCWPDCVAVERCLRLLGRIHRLDEKGRDDDDQIGLAPLIGLGAEQRAEHRHPAQSGMRWVLMSFWLCSRPAIMKLWPFFRSTDVCARRTMKPGIERLPTLIGGRGVDAETSGSISRLISPSCRTVGVKSRLTPNFL